MNKPSVRCAVIGNPIRHSLSPKIHASFAQQVGIALEYDKVQLEPSQLEQFIEEFFSQGGTGLNVTAPFKTEVIKCVSSLSESAKICQSVNTIYRDSTGSLVGHSTDGPGILMDLKRLAFLSNQSAQSPKLNIAIVGAGGASIPVALSLLGEGCRLSVLNRTASKIDNMVKRLNLYGSIAPFDECSENLLDGIISATSVFNQALFDSARNRLKSDGFVYDLNYAERAKDLSNYCDQKQITKFSDGYGMLLGQAAKSFEIWHGKLPSIQV